MRKLWKYLGILIGIFAVLVAAAAIFVFWPYDFPEYEYVETYPPVFDPSNVPLRVAYVINPRFEQMSSTQLDLLLQSLKKESKRLLGIELKVDTVDEISINALFKAIPKTIKEIANLQTFDVSYYDSEDHIRFRDSIYQILSETPGLADEWREYAGKYLSVEEQPNTLETLADTVQKTLLFQLDRLYDVTAIDGQSVIDKSDHHKWTMWIGAGYTELPYDILLTNQVIASPTFSSVEIHSAIRGAMPLGTAAYSTSGRYNGFVFFSTFPFQNSSTHITALRGNENYNKVEQARFAGTYLVHEIGHLLFRYGHPFNKEGCVMNPVKMLLIRNWINSLEPQSCYEEGNGVEAGEAMFHRIVIKEDA